MRKQGCQPFALDPGPPIGRDFEDHLQALETVAVQVEPHGASESDPKIAWPAA